ncbi:hypothetical protein, partial [Sinorhizobium meliloti]
LCASDKTRGAVVHVSFNPIRLKDKTCSRSKCYSDLCASDKTRGAVGMVGGGRGAFFGAVHCRAAAMPHRFEFVAGALSDGLPLYEQTLGEL